MSRVFSWRDHNIVEISPNFGPEDAGWRVNLLDESFPSVERAIAAIERSIISTEKATGQKWHSEPNDLLCVLHNNLYWQCDCGKELVPWSHEHLVNFLVSNLAYLMEGNKLVQFDEFGTPGQQVQKPFQIADSQPGGPIDGKSNSCLLLELWNGVKFLVEVKVVS